MAKLIGRALAGGRRIPSMEYALVGILLAISVVGSVTELDFQMRMAVSGIVSDIYETAVPIPK